MSNAVSLYRCYYPHTLRVSVSRMQDFFYLAQQVMVQYKAKKYWHLCLLRKFAPGQTGRFFAPVFCHWSQALTELHLTAELSATKVVVEMQQSMVIFLAGLCFSLLIIINIWSTKVLVASGNLTNLNWTVFHSTALLATLGFLALMVIWPKNWEFMPFSMSTLWIIQPGMKSFTDFI